jgi:hypothetical protein
MSDDLKIKKFVLVGNIGIHVLRVNLTVVRV